MNGPKLAIGQQWQLDIRLKQPNGLMNPGGFDYEKWLFQNRIAATGYVREGYKINTAEHSFSVIDFLRNLRQKLSDKLDNSLSDYPYKGLIKALSIGYRYDMKPEQWQLFLQTGTNHLIAISGLHIGLISSLIWLLVNLLWKINSHLNMRIPAYYAASIAALLAAVVYAALAGFSIPTQRALTMLLVVFIALMLKREIAPAYVLSSALLMVLIIDPLSPLSLGFWLSFSAVAIIIFLLSSRLSINTERLSKLFQLGKIQLAIFIGLLPLMMLLFHQFSLISPLANLIAVPLMSLIIVPMTLLASALLFIIEPLGILLFEMLKWPIDTLFWYLEQMSLFPVNYYYLSEISLLSIMLVFIACFWLLMPTGWPARWSGLILLLPAFMLSAAEESAEIPAGEVAIDVLDVGQGLSVVLRTRHHSLLYDTGDKFSPQFNMADMVSIPFLRIKGIDQIDKLVISHSDRDHAGSFAELQKLSIKQILSGEAQKIKNKYQQYFSKGASSYINDVLVEQCHQGQQWQWDGVKFEILSPLQSLSTITKAKPKANNQSCVILVTTISNQKILLTGDIEKTVEKQLLRNYPELKANILLVPHHGSKTSSSNAFLDKIRPEIALFSYGYRNRFHHPANRVVQRYKKRKIKLYTTSNGAIEMRRDSDNYSWLIVQYRIKNRRFWHRKPEYL
ncbi:MAG: DNA internalization-related competence protein ComEC/Rec2 [gamma proteobacterium symbiont of Taylorina sp.]|nr:DNA internalization-related competence protein ComEC/Rec2 [gamma proteobacterium symbiont of Taylorina sp.]